MVYGYIRVSSDKQTVENQRFEINNFCQREGMVIDGWIEETISGTKAYNKRQLGILLKRVQKESIRQLRLSNLKVASAKSCIFSVKFHPRLAVSKWIAPRSFSMGGVLGYPTSFLVYTWQAKQYEVLPLPALDNEQVNRSNSHFQNLE